MSEALKSNTTLIELNLRSEGKRTHQRHPSAIHSFHSLFTTTDNNIGDTGAKSLSESLKSNTTLTQLNLWGEDKRRKTHQRHPSSIHFFPFLFTSTENMIGERGATSLSESLKSNTTLTALHLYSEDKRKKTHKRHPFTNHSFPFLITSTVNKIGDTGATSLSESLKSNTTLTVLYLSCEDKSKKRHKRHSSAIHSFPSTSSTGNSIGDAGATSLSESLKSNTTLTKLNLSCEDKRKNTQKTSINNSLFHFSSHQQVTRLEKEERHH